MDRFHIHPLTTAIELTQYQKLACYSFRMADAGLADEKAYGIDAESKRKAAPADDILLGASEGDTLCGGMHLLPYTVYFDGNPTKMCGIGGVISNSAYAGRGVVKALFSEAFRLMKEQNRPVSHLFPFEMQYYRQYGYEVSCSSHTWRIPVRAFRLPGEGNVYPFDNSDAMKTDIRRIYDAFSKRYNLMICKTEDDWNTFFSSHHAYTSGMLSVLHETNGEADAFLSYRPQANENRVQDLIAPNVWFSTLAGLRGILSYFKTQVPYADYVVMTLPEDIDLSGIIECAAGWGKKDSEATLSFLGNSRVVMARALLQRAAVRPGMRGSVTVRVVGDEYCPWNNGFYTVPLDGSGDVIQKDDSTTTPDMECTPGALAAVLFGRYDVDAAGLLPGVRLYGNAEGLRALFYKKPCFIDTHF